jgi:outer membrane lipoprotein SlyB
MESHEGVLSSGPDFAVFVLSGAFARKGVSAMAKRRRKRNEGSTDGRIERAKDAALGAHDRHPSAADQVGEAAGGISGAVIGASVGASGGPAGSIVGGVAGAMGGWWAGRAVIEAADALASDEELRDNPQRDSPEVEREDQQADVRDVERETPRSDERRGEK